MSLAKTGRKRPPFSKKWRENMGKAVSSRPVGWCVGSGGMTGKIHSTESKRKNRESQISSTRVKFVNTSIELKMKQLLNDLGVHYIFQKGIKGVTRVDFYIPSSNLIIECDGCYWHGCPEHHPKNTDRYLSTQLKTLKLQELGYKVIRFWEHEIENMTILKI